MVGSLRERFAGNRRLHCNRQPGCRRTSGELHHQPSRTAYPLSFDGTNSKTWFTARTDFYPISLQPDLPRYQHQNPNRQGHPSVTPLSIQMTRRNNLSLDSLVMPIAALPEMRSCPLFSPQETVVCPLLSFSIPECPRLRTCHATHAGIMRFQTCF